MSTILVDFYQFLLIIGIFIGSPLDGRSNSTLEGPSLHVH